MAAKSFPILMYHRIRSDRCPVPGDDLEESRYAVELAAYQWQMEYLVSKGYRGISVGHAMSLWTEGVIPSVRDVVITFDDGNHSDYEHALPVLQEHGFGATFFIGGDRIGVDGGLTEEMIKDMNTRGMEIGSHGMTHRFLSLLNEDEQRSECEQIHETLGRIIAQPIRYFAPPGGRYDALTISILRDLGYRAVCTSRLGYNAPDADPFELRRIPVMRATTPAMFRGIIERSKRVMLPAYARARTLGFMRSLINENLYKKLRRVLIRG